MLFGMHFDVPYTYSYTNTIINALLKPKPYIITIDFVRNYETHLWHSMIITLKTIVHRNFFAFAQNLQLQVTVVIPLVNVTQLYLLSSLETIIK